MGKMDRLIARWTQHLERHRSPRTAIIYEEGVRGAVDFCARRMRRAPLVSELTVSRLQAFLDDCPHGPDTVQQWRCGLRSFFGFLERTEVLKGPNPTRSLIIPPRPHRLPAFLSEEEARRLVCAPLLAGVPDAERLRDAVVLILLYIAGLRRGEIAGVKVQDLRRDVPEPGYARIEVLGKGKRWGGVTLPGTACDIVQAYLQRRHELAPRCPALIVVTPHGGAPNGTAGEALGAHGVYDLVKRWAKRAGLAAYPHLLRHSCATHLLDQGAELAAVKEQLRHASIASTLVYTHVSGKHLLRRCVDLHPGARPGFFGGAKLEVPMVPPQASPGPAPAPGP